MESVDMRYNEAEQVVIELQEEIERHLEATNKIFSKYKVILDEYLLEGVNVKKEMISAIDAQSILVEKMNASNCKEFMREKHKMLMNPVHRLNHLFVVLESVQMLNFDFLEEKKKFRQGCKNNNLEYNIKNFPNKKFVGNAYLDSTTTSNNWGEDF